MKKFVLAICMMGLASTAQSAENYKTFPISEQVSNCKIITCYI
jgi:hypothetical protein